MKANLGNNIYAFQLNEDKTFNKQKTIKGILDYGYFLIDNDNYSEESSEDDI